MSERVLHAQKDHASEQTYSIDHHHDVIDRKVLRLTMRKLVGDLASKVSNQTHERMSNESLAAR
mgnify:CR=1 FL=1